MEARLGASVMGLLLTACDAISTRKQELDYLWHKPFNPTLTRSLFVLARYLAILIHLADIVMLGIILTPQLHGPKRAPDSHICLISIIFRVIACQIMLLVLHMILYLRVLALYNQDRMIRISLLLLIVIEFAGSTASIVHGFTSRITPQYSGACVKAMTSHNHDRRQNTATVLIFICGELLVQVVLNGLAWKRTMWDLRSAKIAFSHSQTAPGLLSVLNRDGVKVFGGIFAGLLALGAAIFKRGLPVVFIFPLFVTFISFSGTRMILNLQSLSPRTAQSNPQGSDSSTTSSGKDVELSTIPFEDTDSGAVGPDNPVWNTTTFLHISHED